MAKTFIGVRDVDEEVFRKFRAMAIQERMKLGGALTKAMERLIVEGKKEHNESKAKVLLEIKPFSWGKGTEKTSKEIDKILYGAE